MVSVLPTAFTDTVGTTGIFVGLGVGVTDGVAVGVGLGVTTGAALIVIVVLTVFD